MVFHNVVWRFTRRRAVALCVFDVPINCESLRAWVDQQLRDTIASGDNGVMDSPGSHKAMEIRRVMCAGSQQA